MTEAEARNAVCSQARAWLGCKESDGSFQPIIDLYNENRLPGTYKMTYADPWCAAFVSAVGMACGMRDIILPHVNCDGMIAAYQAQGRFIRNPSYIPAPGDIIFYDWNTDGSSDHVGIVFSARDNEVTVIEGNRSDAVMYRTLTRGNSTIFGYAVPAYGTTPAEPEHEPPEEEPEPPALIEGLPTLKKGDKGWAVKSAQGMLIAHGCSCGPDGADGDFGRNTNNAVINFQRKHLLEPDGVIGVKTWTVLLTGVMD